MTKPHQAWDRYAISAEVKRRGMTLTGIARDAGLYDSACRQGLSGGSRVGAKAIAQALGEPFSVLFPSYGKGHNSKNNLSLNSDTGKRQKSANAVDETRAA